MFLGSWELRVSQWQLAANKLCPHESIEIATLCRVAPAELRTMPHPQSHAKSRSLRNATKSALSAYRGRSARTSQGSADMAADAALKGKDNGIKKLKQKALSTAKSIRPTQSASSTEQQRDYSAYECHRCQKKVHIARDRPKESTESPVKVWTWLCFPHPSPQCSMQPKMRRGSSIYLKLRDKISCLTVEP